jgi:hypothetical protein
MMPENMLPMVGPNRVIAIMMITAIPIISAGINKLAATAFPQLNLFTAFIAIM